MSVDYRTPLRRVRGHGAAHSGTQHFITQRLSALGLAILAPWFVISAALNVDFGYASARAWVADPINATGLVLLIAAAFYHMWLGLATIIEDYVSSHAGRAFWLIVNTFASIVVGVAAIFAVLSISLRG